MIGELFSRGKAETDMGSADAQIKAPPPPPAVETLRTIKARLDPMSGTVRLSQTIESIIGAGT